MRQTDSETDRRTEWQRPYRQLTLSRKKKTIYRLLYNTVIAKRFINLVGGGGGGRCRQVTVGRTETIQSRKISL